MAPSQVARGLFGHLVWLLGQGSISGNSQVCGGSFAAPGDRAGWRLHCWEGVTSPGQEGPQGQPGSVPWGLHCLELLPTPRTWGWPSTPWHLQGTGLGMSQVLRWWHRLRLPRVGSAENHCILKMRGQVKSCASLGDPRGAPELGAWLGTPRDRPGELIPSSAVPVPPTDPFSMESWPSRAVWGSSWAMGEGFLWVCPLLSGPR